jgi:hypothetical protein
MNAVQNRFARLDELQPDGFVSSPLPSISTGELVAVIGNRQLPGVGPTLFMAFVAHELLYDEEAADPRPMESLVGSLL